MVTGSGLQNRDEELFDHKPFLVIADFLAKNGIASLRFDDRTMGKSTGDVKDATTYNFMEPHSAFQGVCLAVFAVRLPLRHHRGAGGRAGAGEFRQLPVPWGRGRNNPARTPHRLRLRHPHRVRLQHRGEGRRAHRAGGKPAHAGLDGPPARARLSHHPHAPVGHAEPFGHLAQVHKAPLGELEMLLQALEVVADGNAAFNGLP